MGKYREKRVLIVGSAEESGGGVASAIRLMKKMPVWHNYHCYWLGTQIQAGKWTKLRYALTAYLKALFIIWRYDIVHFHTVPNVSMKIQLPVFLLALLGRKKIILHLHVGNQLTMAQYVNFKLGHWCMQKADMLVLLADMFAGYLDKYWKDVKTPRQVIHNACEEVIEIPYEQHQKTILFCGRFTDNKRADILIKAFGKIHQKYPDWRLQLLAKGPEEEGCRQLAKQLGIEAKVEMPGFVYGEEKAKYYRQAGLFCLCSHYEGFPMVVLEAWAYGVPVLTTPVGALPDVVKDGKNGFIYNIDDVDGLVEKLDLLMANDELRLKMSRYSIEYAKRFSLQTINGQLEELYLKVLK